MTNSNPFTFGNPVSDPGCFYGRGEEIRQIVNRLKSSALESTSIVGERRMGKTSLLKYLANPPVAANLGLTEDKFCLVYIDFQGLTDITPQRFWQRVLRKMSRVVTSSELAAEIKNFSKIDTFDLFDLEDLFEIISEEGLNTILLMDEFEYVTQNPNFKADFFGGLRALAIHQKLALLTTTRRELVDLCHSEEIKGSPFFNIFANVVLRPLNKHEVDDLIEGYIGKSGLTLLTDEKDMIVRLGGGHPFFIQMAGYYLLEKLIQGIPQGVKFKKIVDQFDHQADPHFDYYWSRCTDSEKITLLVVMALNRQKPTKETITYLDNLAKVYPRARFDVPDLVKRGLLVEVRETFTTFSPSLERWISREIAAIPGEEETADTVKTWLDTGGKDQLEPVVGVMQKFKKKYWPVVGTVMKELSFELVGAATFELLLKMIV
jgi:serine/threonine-protein kinase